MKKKIFLISGIVAGVAIITFTIIYFLGSKSDKIIEPIKSVPDGAAVIIELNYPTEIINSLRSDSTFISDFSEVLSLNSNNSLLLLIDTMNICPFIKTNEYRNKIIWSFHPENSSVFNQLVIVQLNENQKQDKVTDEIKTKLQTSGKISDRDFNGVRLYEYKSTKSYPTIHFYSQNSLIVFSSSQKLIESSATSLTSNKSVMDKTLEFKSLYNTAGKKELANIYVNMNLFPDSFLRLLNESSKSSMIKLKEFNSWAELDLSFDKNKLSLNGFSEVSDSIPVFANILKSQEPTNLQCSEVLPDNTSYFFALAFNNSESFRENLDNYNQLIEMKTNYDQECASIKDKYGVDLRSSFYSMINNEVCLAITIPGNFDMYENSYTILGLQSQTTAEMELENLFNGIKAKTGVSDNQLKDKIKIDENTTVDVFIFPFENTPELLFGNYFANCSGKYACCINNHMIFANSKNSLFKIVYDIVLHKTLETNIDYNLFLENFSEKSNLFVYFSMFNGMQIFQNIFNDNYKSFIGKKEDIFYSFGNFGYQINQSNGMLYNNLVIKQQKYTIEKPQTVWESRLDTTCSIKPVLVTNHDNNTKEILVQDHKNKIYLLSNSGREIWSVRISEQIESEVYQIDRYKNGKLQYLFSTKNQIHLIDRLGNYVDKYPIDLRAQASAPLSLFDYNNSKDYRIIIPCTDNKVYLYDAEGDIVKGWDFESAENKVSSEIFHHSYNNKDYIVFHDAYKAYFLNRKGESRIDFLTKFKFSDKNGIYFDYSYSKPRFVTTDENGILRYFYPDGRQDSLKLKDFTKNHYFTLKDINSDGSLDYVFLDESLLEVYNRQKKLILSYQFEAEPTSYPVFYSFPRNQIKIGVVCSSVSKIYLINNNGTLFDGFPLYGLTPFSIGYLSSESNKFNLIVGGQENLLYNYEVKEN